MLDVAGSHRRPRAQSIVRLPPSPDWHNCPTPLRTDMAPHSSQFSRRLGRHHGNLARQYNCNPIQSRTDGLVLYLAFVDSGQLPPPRSLPFVNPPISRSTRGRRSMGGFREYLLETSSCPRITLFTPTTSSSRPSAVPSRARLSYQSYRRC